MVLSGDKKITGMKDEIPVQFEAVREEAKLMKEEITKEIENISKNFDLTTICNPKT